jgi:acyl-CoA oxidase
VAKLITKGENCGNHLFIVQFRSMEDHKLLNGISVGDVGPKFGLDESDNGFLQLTNVRIPRDQMLMRFTKVAPDGTYSSVTGWQKMFYTAILFGRSNLITSAARIIEEAILIAIRYSAVRCQGSPQKGS